MTQHDKFTKIIKQAMSGMLPRHIVEEIAPKIAERLIKEGAVIGGNNDDR